MKKIFNNTTPKSDLLQHSHLLFCRILLLTMVMLSPFSLWAQEAATEEAKKDAGQATEEGGSAIIKKSQPQRLSSNIPRSMTPADPKANMQALATKFPKGASNWLSTRHGDFYALWQADRSGDGKGAVLIIHAEGEHPAWPTTTKPLHDSLPDYGWATLAISLPLADPVKIPKRTLPAKVAPIKTAPTETEAESAAENKDETAKKDNNSVNDNPAENKPAENSPVENKPAENSKRVSAEQITGDRITAALKFLHDKGQFNIVIMGNGIGAIRAHRFIEEVTPQVTNQNLRKKIEKPIRALLLFNARNRLPSMTDDYSEWFSDPDLPIVDIFTVSDYRNKQEAKKRAILAKQKKAINYKQIKSSPISQEVAWGENRLSRRIRSFLEASVKGIEVNKK